MMSRSFTVANTLRSAGYSHADSCGFAPVEGKRTWQLGTEIRAEQPRIVGGTGR